MTPIRKPQNTSQKKSILLSSQNLFFLHPEQYLRKLSERLFYCDSPNYCVCLSLVLIQVVKILGGGGTSNEDWYPLVLETASSSRNTS